MLRRIFEFLRINLTIIGCAVAALAIAFSTAPAWAQTQTNFAVSGSSLSGTYAAVTCPGNTDNCFENTVSGPISKVIGGIPAGGRISMTIFGDQSTGSTAHGGLNGTCYVTEGNGSITNHTGTNVLEFLLEGWTCDPNPASVCLTGPLTVSIVHGIGRFALSSGVATLVAQSPSCFHASDVQVAIKGVIIK